MIGAENIVNMEKKYFLKTLKTIVIILILKNMCRGLSYIQSMKKQLNGTKFLNDFSKNFRKQQLAQGREIIN